MRSSAQCEYFTKKNEETNMNDSFDDQLEWFYRQQKKNTNKIFIQTLCNEFNDKHEMGKFVRYKTKQTSLTV